MKVSNEHWWNYTARRKQKYSEKNCLSVILTTTCHMEFHEVELKHPR